MRSVHIDWREIALVAKADVFEPLGVLLVGQELPRAELDRTLERHTVLALTGLLSL
jgi:hypothetical protein